MSNVTVIGAQWGDEGKGKIVDWLASRAEIVVRFQGGHNAGHTLVVGNQTYKLSLLPSGLVRGKMGIIGNGVVVDPEALLDEIARVEAQGLHVGPDVLRVADNAILILPVHGALDRAREAARGERRIGTTGRGIGPAYEDKVARRAIRLCDLAEPDTLDWKLDEILLHHNTLLAGLGADTVSKDALLDYLLGLAPRLLPYVEPVWERLDEARRAGTRVLFEGAQAVMLDVDHGTYPFVTSSNTVAANAATGSGVGPGAVGFVLGIAKAYTTRVGAGPCWCGARCVSAASPAWRSPSSTCWTGSPPYASAPATAWTGSRCATCPRPPRRRRVSSRSTRPWTAGRTAPAAPAPGARCRPPRSSTSAESRSWSRRR